VFRTSALAAAAALALAAAAVAAPETRDPAKVPAGDYVLDTRHASLSVKIAHLGGFSNYAMRFDKLDGRFTYDPARPEATVVTISVDPKSIHTGLDNFDRELAGPRYFDSARFASISFVSRKLEILGEGRGRMTGDVTFMGQTRPVTLDVTFNGVGPGMMGTGTRLGFSGTGALKRSEWGFKAAENSAGDEVKLDFEVEFTKRP
jgi:polyisoprenoid-binding protein YceI